MRITLPPIASRGESLLRTSARSQAAEITVGGHMVEEAAANEEEEEEGSHWAMYELLLACTLKQRRKSGEVHHTKIMANHVPQA